MDLKTLLEKATEDKKIISTKPDQSKTDSGSSEINLMISEYRTKLQKKNEALIYFLNQLNQTTYCRLKETIQKKIQNDENDGCTAKKKSNGTSSQNIVEMEYSFP